MSPAGILPDMTNEVPRVDTGTCEQCSRPNRARFPHPTTGDRICLDCMADWATQITDTTGRFLCPRRVETPPATYLGAYDTWRRRPGDRDDVTGLTCSHCGSLHPLGFFQAVTNDVELGPTDKSYKVYIGRSGARKFYFQHLSVDDRMRFIELVNARVPNIGYPGYFYTLPFFMTRG